MKIDRAVKSANKAKVLDSVTSNTTVAPVEAKRIQKSTPLSAAEKRLLAKHEQTISKGLKTFKQVGEALLEVRDKGLYRDQYGTFKEYCQKKWHVSVRRAYQLMDASAVVQSLECEQLFTKEPVAIPATEGAARPLATLPADKQVAAARIVAQEPGEHTAKDFQDAANEVLRKAKVDEADITEEEEKPRVQAYTPPPVKSGITSTNHSDLENLLELLDEAQTKARRIVGCDEVAKTLGDLARVVTRKLNGGAK